MPFLDARFFGVLQGHLVLNGPITRPFQVVKGSMGRDLENPGGCLALLSEFREPTVDLKENFLGEVFCFCLTHETPEIRDHGRAQGVVECFEIHGTPNQPSIRACQASHITHRAHPRSRVPMTLGSHRPMTLEKWLSAYLLAQPEEAPARKSSSTWPTA